LATAAGSNPVEMSKSLRVQLPLSPPLATFSSRAKFSCRTNRMLVHGGAVQSGVDACLSRKRPRVQIPPSPPCDNAFAMSEEKQVTRILLAEDNLADAFLFQTVLGSGDFALNVASSLKETIEFARNEEHDIVLLNLSLPDSEGLDTLAELVRHVGQIPIIALTGIDDIESGPLAIRLGAQDFLAKTDATRSLLRLPDVIANAIERKRVIDSLVGPQNRNSLTNLMKTGAIIDWVGHLLTRQGDPPSFAVVAMELSGLPWVRQEFGDDAWDIALVALSQRLSKQIRSYDMPALIRPDELAVALDRIKDPDHLVSITERLIKGMSEPLEIHGMEFYIRIYSSTIYCGNRGTDPQELIETVCRAARSSMETDSDTISVHNASMIPPWNTGE
jgi:two-component system cell cycle response regulator